MSAILIVSTPPKVNKKSYSYVMWDKENQDEEAEYVKKYHRIPEQSTLTILPAIGKDVGATRYLWEWYEVTIN